MKKVMIVSVSAGSGHIRSAQALEAAFKEHYPDLPIQSIDALNYTTKAFGKIYAGSYLKMANDLPTLWGYLYDHTDRNREKSKGSQIASFIQKMNAARLFKVIKTEHPGFVLCTHFLPTSLLVPFVRKRKMRTRIGVVVTDYDMHCLWFKKHVHHYFVANEAISFKLQKMGTPSNRISITGIPVHPLFSRSARRSELLQRFDLKDDHPTILIISGGFGDHQIKEVLTAIMSGCPRSQILAVAGKSKKVKKIFDTIIPSNDVTLHSFGFVDFMQDLMSVSDIAISKAGGLITAECMAKKLPMLIFSPIPGQEERNSDFILENGAGIKVNSVIDLEFKLKNFFSHSDIARQFRRNAKKIARPDAAFTIVEKVHHFMHKA